VGRIPAKPKDKQRATPETEAVEADDFFSLPGVGLESPAATVVPGNREIRPEPGPLLDPAPLGDIETEEDVDDDVSPPSIEDTGDQVATSAPVNDAAPTPAYQVLSLSEHELEIAVGDRVWHATGFNIKRLGVYGLTLKVWGVTHEGERNFFVGDVNLARSRSRSEFVCNLTGYLVFPEEVIRRDLHVLVTALESLTRENLRKQTAEKQVHVKTFEATGDELAAAEAYLREHDLLTGTLYDDLEKLGFVTQPGTRWGALVLYLVATSRKLSRPLSVLSLGLASSGKSMGQEIMQGLLPDDEFYSFTRLTPKSLSHFGPHDLTNKALFLDEFTARGDDGSMSQLKSLLSRGFLTTSLASLNRVTGVVETVSKDVHGPVSFFSAITHERGLDDELRSRFLILPVDESSEQTRRVMEKMLERDTEDGLRQEGERREIRRKYRLIQKVLKSVKVIIPEAWREKIKFNSQRITYRRKFQMYLSLVCVITLHRQFQRRVSRLPDPSTGGETTFITAEAEDIRLANQIMENLFAVATDELNPVNRRVYEQIKVFCQAEASAKGLPETEVSFTRREIRYAAQLDETPTRRAFEQLLQLEYVEKVRGGDQGSRHFYRLSHSADGHESDGLHLWTPGEGT